MQTFIFILGIITFILLVATGISLLVTYIKYRRELKIQKSEFGDDIFTEFYFKFLTIGWKIKGGEAKDVLLSEKNYSLHSK